MKNIDGIKLNINSTIKEALKIIDSGAMRIALVAVANRKYMSLIRLQIGDNQLLTYLACLSI